MTKKRSSPTAESLSTVSIPRGFAEVFSELKQKIQNARLSAAITVNQRLIKLYWEIGKIIFEIQQTQKWGSRDIESLGNELQKEFPGISGFSRSNLFKMRAFYLSYEKVSQTVKQFEELPVSQIPWGHNVILVTKIKDTKERLWYAHMIIEEGWSREALEDAIASKFFHRHGKAITNFKDRLPEPQSQLAQEVLKDPYQFDFLELRNGYKERELEQGQQFSVSKDKLLFKIVEYSSDEYKKAVALCEEILRKPLGLNFTKEELALEKDHVRIAGFLGQEMCTTAVLVPDGDALKMQRVATKAQFQGKGIGASLIQFCEEYARQHGFKSIYCHARGTAVQFYLKNQYQLESEPFDEDGIPHRKMRKII